MKVPAHHHHINDDIFNDLAPAGDRGAAADFNFYHTHIRTAHDGAGADNRDNHAPSYHPDYIGARVHDKLACTADHGEG